MNVLCIFNILLLYNARWMSRIILVHWLPVVDLFSSLGNILGACIHPDFIPVGEQRANVTSRHIMICFKINVQ